MASTNILPPVLRSRNVSFAALFLLLHSQTPFSAFLDRRVAGAHARRLSAESDASGAAAGPVCRRAGSSVGKLRARCATAAAGQAAADRLEMTLAQQGPATAQEKQGSEGSAGVSICTSAAAAGVPPTEERRPRNRESYPERF